MSVKPAAPDTSVFSLFFPVRPSQEGIFAVAMGLAMGLAMQAIALCGVLVHAVTPERSTHALRALALPSDQTKLRASEYRKKLDGAAAKVMQGVTRGSLLMEYYTAQWQKAPESPIAFFIALDFNMIVEGHAREGKLVPMGEFLDLWAQLDWNRKHFLVLQQCSPEQLEHYAQKLQPEFQLLHQNLTVFDSRLTNLKLATRHPALQAWQLRRVGEQPAAAWAARHMVPIPVFHGDDPHSRKLTTLSNCSGSVKSGAYFAGSIKHGPRPSEDEEPSARKAIYSMVTHDETLMRRVKVDAYRVNDTVGQVPFDEFAKSLCDASWALVGSGTFTPSFMTVEAIHAGTLPIFVVGNGTCCRPEGLPMARAGMLFARDYDNLLPFYDEGVRFSRFGEIVPVGALTAPLIRQLIDSKDDSLVAKRQALKDVAPRFTPEGTWQYILRRMHMPDTSSVPLPAENALKGRSRSAKLQPDGNSELQDSSAVLDNLDPAEPTAWHHAATRKPKKSWAAVDSAESESHRGASKAKQELEATLRPTWSQMSPAHELRQRPASPEPNNVGDPAAPDGWHYMLNEWLPHVRSLMPSPLPAEKLDTSCTRCGTSGSHASAAPNCCSAGGTWEGMCEKGGEHSWHEGFQACSITSAAIRRLTVSGQGQETKRVPASKGI